ncbi:MAG: permease, partial [Phycisphaerae bacterium]
LGIARAVGAILFSIVIGLAMHCIFRKEERAKAEAQAAVPEPEAGRPLWRTALFFAAMVGILVSANWGKPDEASGAVWRAIYSVRWVVAGVLTVALAAMILGWFRRAELGEWCGSTWGFAKQILPLLFVGVLAAGFLLGRPGHEGLIPSEWVSGAVGGNSLRANLFASVAGALMYFATLTEVPILQGLLGSGMGKGPALALLLAGPALSLPNMLVIRSILGTKKTLVYVALVIVMATASGLTYGALFR